MITHFFTFTLFILSISILTSQTPQRPQADERRTENRVLTTDRRRHPGARNRLVIDRPVIEHAKLAGREVDGLAGDNVYYFSRRSQAASVISNSSTPSSTTSKSPRLYHLLDDDYPGVQFAIPHATRRHHSTKSLSSRSIPMTTPSKSRQLYHFANDQYPDVYPDVQFTIPAAARKPHSKPPIPYSGLMTPSITPPIMLKLSEPTSGPITGAPATPTQNVYKTIYPAGVTGPPGSYSQTSTTDLYGLATVLPVWFAANGAAVVVVLTAGTLIDKPPPPPPGFPELEIDSDGEAQPEDQKDSDDDSKKKSDDNAENRSDDDPEPKSDDNSHKSVPPVGQSSNQGLSTLPPRNPQESVGSSSAIQSLQSASRASPTDPFPQISSVIQSSPPSVKSSMTTAIRSTTPASASSSIPIQDYYLIIPKDAKNMLNIALTSELLGLFGSKLYTLENKYIGEVLYWRAPLNQQQLDHYRNHGAVSTHRVEVMFALLSRNSRLIYKRSRIYYWTRYRKI